MLRERRHVLAMAAVAAGAIAIDVVWLHLGLGGLEVTAAVDGGFALIASVICAVLTAQRARASADRETRLGWLGLAVSSALFAGGVLISIGYVFLLNVSVPFPSLADAAYLADDSILPAAVLLLSGRTLGGARLRLLLDGAIVTGALFLLSWLTTLHVVYLADHGSALTFAVGLAYPVSDMVTAVIVLSALSHSRRLDPSLLLIGAAMLAFSAADSLFTNFGYSHPSVIDAGEVVGYALTALASRLGLQLGPSQAESERHRWQLFLPYVPMVAAGSIVLVDIVRGRPLDLVAQLLVAAVVGLVLVRQLTVVAESQSLARRLAATSAAQQALLEEVRRQVGRAARIQRELLPRSAPDLRGYEMAGACRPADDVAGDFYDWVLTDHGELDLTVADVMGKGMAAALVMATLRAALRSARPDLGPAARLELAARSITLGADEEGMFATAFHARLYPRTGVLRYVDAGHGYCRLRRPDGTLVSLPVRSLPVGVPGAERFDEGSVQLEPGDTLIVYSDGLVELDGPAIALHEFEPDLADAADAGDAVSRMMGRVTGRQPDDVTVVVLRRLTAPADQAGGGSRSTDSTGRTGRFQPASSAALRSIRQRPPPTSHTS
jgi:serine phosphatase RsbU (regulator of sigma subunit)